MKKREFVSLCMKLIINHSFSEIDKCIYMWHGMWKFEIYSKWNRLVMLVRWRIHWYDTHCVVDVSCSHTVHTRTQRLNGARWWWVSPLLAPPSNRSKWRKRLSLSVCISNSSPQKRPFRAQIEDAITVLFFIISLFYIHISVARAKSRGALVRRSRAHIWLYFTSGLYF